jgi:vacuolar-type H+-ATPase subunit F/Vma7
MYNTAFAPLGENGFAKYFTAESKQRFERKQLVEKIEKQLNFMMSDNPAGCGQFLKPDALLNPEKVEFCSKAVSELEKIKDMLQKELEQVQVSFEQLKHPKTGEIRKFATEQVIYNENQIGLLIELKKKQEDIKEDIEQYISNVKKAYVILPNTRKKSKQSRAKKEQRSKNKKNKKKRHMLAALAFLNAAMDDETKNAYFENGVIDLEQNITPLSTLDVTPEALLTVHHTQRLPVVVYLQEKGWLALDVLTELCDLV